MDKYKKPLLIIIILFSLAIRLYKIQSFPFFPYGDEIHPATSIISYMTTGKDVDGKIHAFLYDPMMSTPPIIGISMIPFLIIFGKGVLAIRLASVSYALLSVIIIYKLACYLTKNVKIGLLSALFYSIIPWAFHYSKVGWEPASQLFFMPLSIYLLLMGRSSPKYLTLGFIISGISIYSYSTSILLSPLYLVMILLIYHKDYFKSIKYIPLGFLLFFIISTPALYAFLKEPDVNQRPKRIFITTNKTPSEAFLIFKKSYLEHFSINFLFLTGDPNIRHGARNQGVLYLFMFPFIIIGLIYFLRKRDRSSVFILFWLLAFPLGSSLTDDGNPHATRSLIGSSLFALISATGIVYFFSFLKNTSVRILAGSLIFILISLSTFNYLKNYYIKYPIDLYNSQSWDLNQAPIFEYVQKNLNKYQRVCFNHYGSWATDRFILYYFTPFNNPNIIYNNYRFPEYKKNSNAINMYNNEDKCNESGSLLVLSIEKKLTGIEPIKKIFGLDGKEEYEIYSF